MVESLTASLHQASASMLRQLCDDASDTVLIENNRVLSEQGCNPISSDSIVFNENSIASIVAALTLTLGVNGPLESLETTIGAIYMNQVSGAPCKCFYVLL